MDEVATGYDGPLLLIGDFHSVISQSDKIGGRPVASSSPGGMHRLLTDHGLIDLGFHGHPYTWNNGRVGGANIQARLDRSFTNDQWWTLFPEVSITHLPAIQSDHRPLLLKLHTV